MDDLHYSNASMGHTYSLNSGTTILPQASFPATFYSSYKVRGNRAYNHFHKYFSPKAQVAY